MLRIPSQLIKLASREEDWEIFLGSSDDYNIQAGMRTIDFDSDQPYTKQCLEISRDWFPCSKRLHAPVPLHMLFSPLGCSSLSLLSTWKKKIILQHQVQMSFSYEVSLIFPERLVSASNRSQTHVQKIIKCNCSPQ